MKAPVCPFCHLEVPPLILADIGGEIDRIAEEIRRTKPRSERRRHLYDMAKALRTFQLQRSVGR